MRLLLHICCAGCLDAMLAGLREEFGDSLAVTGYFYNPNIHPLLEFRKRLKAVKVINEALRLPIHYHETYGLETFMKRVWLGSGEPAPGTQAEPAAKNLTTRCERCYFERLYATAKFAVENGFKKFSSTLCVSVQQDHNLIRKAAGEAAKRWGGEFFYRDLRKFTGSVPRRRGIYSQQYCGCVFSEEARYRATGKEIYRGSGP